MLVQTELVFSVMQGSKSLSWTLSASEKTLQLRTVFHKMVPANEEVEDNIVASAFHLT